MTWANSRYPRDPDGRIMPRPQTDLGKPDQHPPASGPARRVPTSNTSSNTAVAASDAPQGERQP